MRQPAHTSLRALFASAADAPVRARLSFALGCAASGAGFAVLAPLALARLIDSFAVAGASADFGPALALALAYVGALGLERLCEQGQGYFFGTGEQRLQQRLNAAMFAHVLRLPIAFHIERPGGGVMQTLTLGLEGARIILSHLAFSMAPVLIQAGFVIAVLATLLDFGLWATAALALLAYAGVFAVGVRRLERPTEAVMNAQVAAGGLFADGLANVEPVKAFSAERHMSARYTQVLDEAEARWRFFHARRLENGLAAVCVLALTLGIVLTQALLALSAGRVSIGEFVLLNTYLLQIVRPLEMLGFALRDMAQGAQYLSRWRDLLNSNPEPSGTVRGGGACDVQVLSKNFAAPAISFENVRFAYDESRETLKGVSFLARAGKLTALVGASGAGKSSLLRLLLRYYEPKAGRILIGQQPLGEIEIDVLRAQIGVVSQDTILLNASLAENLRLAKPDATASEMERALCLARLDDLVARLPEGLSAIVGERGLKLSGGERQRVAIARAALKDAPILVFDEATSALDGETERAICADMIAAAHGRTGLFITHRLSVAARADAIVVLDNGEVVEEGSHDDLLALEGAYARAWALQQGDSSRSHARIAGER